MCPPLHGDDLPDDLPQDACGTARAEVFAKTEAARLSLRCSACGSKPSVVLELFRCRKHWKQGLEHLRPPVDNTLQGTSSWINLITGRDKQTPAGWQGEDA